MQILDNANTLWGVDLTLPINNRGVYFVDDNALAACFEKDGRITEQILAHITSYRDEEHMSNRSLEEARRQFLLYQAEDGDLRPEVRLEDETVWPSQKLMADLFQNDVRTINHHINSIYKEGELNPSLTVRKYGIV
jgi:hypothetical protein